MKRLYIDLETSGLLPYKHAIIQIGGIIEIDGKTVETFSYDLKPHSDEASDDKTLAFHLKRGFLPTGTRDDFFDPKFKTPDNAHRLLLGKLGAYVNKFDKIDKFQLVGFNLQNFDLPFLVNFFKRCNDDYFFSWVFSPGLDVMQLAAFALQERRSMMKNFKLGTVAETLGILVDESKLHDATYDILITKKVMEKSLDRLRHVDKFNQTPVLED